MRREHAESDDQRQRAPGPVLAVADAPGEGQQRHRQQRRHEQLAVVARRDERGHLPRHHIRHRTDHGRRAAQAEAAQEGQRRDAREHQVQHHPPGHREIRRQQHSQQLRRIEDVAVHRGDVRHSAHQVRIPLRDAGARTQRSRGELAKRIARDVLVAVRIDEEAAAEGRVRQRHRRGDDHGDAEPPLGACRRHPGLVLGHDDRVRRFERADHERNAAPGSTSRTVNHTREVSTSTPASPLP